MIRVGCHYSCLTMRCYTGLNSEQIRSESVEIQQFCHTNPHNLFSRNIKTLKILMSSIVHFKVCHRLNLIFWCYSPKLMQSRWNNKQIATPPPPQSPPPKFFSFFFSIFPFTAVYISPMEELF